MRYWDFDVPLRQAPIDHVNTKIKETAFRRGGFSTTLVKMHTRCFFWIVVLLGQLFYISAQTFSDSEGLFDSPPPPFDDFERQASDLFNEAKKSAQVSRGLAIAIPIVAVCIVVVVLYLIYLYIKGRQRGAHSTGPEPVLNSVESQARPLPAIAHSNDESETLTAGGYLINLAREFSLAEVLLCTSNHKTLIGKGGFGSVYYGKLPNGFEVAVKVNLQGSAQGKPEFVTEVSLLSRIHHRNLVSLIGYCQQNGQQILIYEYMSEGTLQDHLYGEDVGKRLKWRDRLQIALDSAKGLDYLHNGCKPKVIHRDIKSTNILLDSKLEAKVADFGISKLFPEDQTNSITTLIRGTFGYLDPEYFSSGHLTHKSDIFSFGVLLLELICGRRPYIADHDDPQQCNLVDWVRAQFKEKNFDSLVDPAVKSSYCRTGMEKVITLAMACVDVSRMNRPDMDQVVRVLSEAMLYELEADGKNGGGKDDTDTTLSNGNDITLALSL